MVAHELLVSCTLHLVTGKEGRMKGGGGRREQRGREKERIEARRGHWPSK